MPMLRFLAMGITPKKLAITLALGICIGLIPLLGVSTVLLTLLAIIFRLNLVAIHTVQYSVYPLQLIFLVPFFKVSSIIFNQPVIPYKNKEILDMLMNNWWDSLLHLFRISTNAIMVWTVLMIPLGVLIYTYSYRFFRNHHIEYHPETSLREN